MKRKESSTVDPAAKSSPDPAAEASANPVEEASANPVEEASANPVEEASANLMEEAAANPAADYSPQPAMDPSDAAMLANLMEHLEMRRSRNRGEGRAAARVVNPADLAAGPEAPPNYARVYYTSTPALTLYVSKRDFVHHETHIDPVDGIIVFDPQHVDNRKVHISVAALFRYGRHNLDVVGMGSEKVVCEVVQQIYPPIWGRTPLTRLQKRLMDDLNQRHMYPYSIQLPLNFPNSVVLQASVDNDEEGEENKKPFGIVHEIRAYIGDDLKEIQYPDVTRIPIRKVRYAPAREDKQPTIEKRLTFIPTEGTFHLECTLDKAIYNHGETIAVNIDIANNTKHTVRKIVVSVRQSVRVFLYSLTNYKNTIVQVKTEPKFKIEPGAHMSRIFHLTPLSSDVRKKSGIVIDGQLDNTTENNLASTTRNVEEFSVEDHGVIVEYMIKTKVYLSRIGSFITNRTKVNLPFTLMCSEPTPRVVVPTIEITPADPPANPDNDPGVIHEDLIILESDSNDEDMDHLFEGF